MSDDPIATADDLCEILARPDWQAHEAELAPLVGTAGGALDGALGEVARRGWLARLISANAGQAVCDQCVDGAASDATLAALAGVLCAVDHGVQGSLAAAPLLDRLVLRADALGRLPALFLAIATAGLYEDLLALLAADETQYREALGALLRARPSFGEDALNAPALRFLAANPCAPAGTYDMLIVPGLTPVKTTVPLALADVPEATQRVALAVQDFQAGRAPLVFVTGGSVHPPGTPHNEGLMMRDYLLAHGVPAERVIVDPYARHSTTNLRNAGRFLRAHDLPSALIVTGFDNPTVFDQAFYFGHPILSDFNDRCRRDLGYVVGQLNELDAHHVGFSPAPEVTTVNDRDPWDW